MVWTIFKTLRNLQVAQGACHSILNTSLMVHTSFIHLVPSALSGGGAAQSSAPASWYMHHSFILCLCFVWMWCNTALSTSLLVHASFIHLVPLLCLDVVQHCPQHQPPGKYIILISCALCFVWGGGGGGCNTILSTSLMVNTSFLYLVLSFLSGGSLTASSGSLLVTS